jgi:uncharacterized protein YjbJ (UPF0337 family)
MFRRLRGGVTGFGRKEAMAHDLKLEGKFDQLKGRIKEAWGTLTDDDLDRSEGKVDRLVGIIKEKTGEATDTIEEKLKSLVND